MQMSYVINGERAVIPNPQKLPNTKMWEITLSTWNAVSHTKFGISACFFENLVFQRLVLTAYI